MYNGGEPIMAEIFPFGNVLGWLRKMVMVVGLRRNIIPMEMYNLFGKTGGGKALKTKIFRLGNVKG